MTDWLLITVFILSIVCNVFSFALIIAKYRERYSVIRAIVYGAIGYFFAQIIVSAILFWFDIYSIYRSAFITFGISVLSVVLSIIKNKFSGIKKIEINKKEIIFFLAIILVTLILSGEKFGFYGMGQDQGVYQTKAIELIFDNNSNEYDFDYVQDVLTDENDYRFFREKVGSLTGYYLLGQTDPKHIEEGMGGESGLRGIYHGLPTWPAILALFGKMFGMSHMQDCQTVFLICFLMMAFYLLENFKIKTVCEAAAVAILGTTPQLIWVSKSALTEMLLAVIVITYIYIICHENKNIRLLMWIPVVVFSFFHISVYTIMPLFVFISWINNLSDKRKRSILPTFLMLVGYLASFAYSFKLETLYTLYNYINPLNNLLKYFAKKGLSGRGLTILITVTATVCVVLSVLIKAIINNKKSELLINKICLKKGEIIKVTSIIIVAFAIVRYIMINGGLKYNPSCNIVAISVASGEISLILIIIGMLLVKKDKVKGTPYIFLYSSFLYILIWAVSLRPYTQYYYYYGRYNVPFIAIIIIFMNVLYKDFKKTDWLPAICGASILVYLNYDMVMVKTPDDTEVEWNVMESVLLSERLPNSVAIIHSDYPTLLEWMLTIKASGTDTFPYDGDLNSQTGRLLEYYDNVYYLYEGTADINEFTSMPFEIESSYTFTRSEDMVNGTESWTGYPEYFDTEEREVSVYLLK